MPTRALVTSHYDDLKLFPDLWHKLGIALGAAVVFAYPFLANAKWMAVGNGALVAIVASVALMILTGFAGQISMGHAAFLALGAYTAAILGKAGIPFWLVLPAAGIVAAGIGLAIGVFALRLQGLYLAIVTIGLLVLVQHTLLSFPSWTGGLAGTSVPVHLWFAESGAPSAFARTWMVGGVELTFERKLFFLFLLLAIGTAYAAKNLHRSNVGRAMMAVRDQDLAAAVLGVNATRTKVLAFGISSFIAGVAGAMFGFQQQYITVEPPFDLNMSVMYIAMIVLGGVGTVFGAVAGALAFSFLTPLAELAGSKLPLISQLSSAHQSTVLFALLVIGFLALEPLGLLGIWLRVKRYFLAWPFRY